MCWYQKTEFGGKGNKRKKPEEKVLELNAGEINQNKGKFFKGMCNTCGKYGHRA